MTEQPLRALWQRQQRFRGRFVAAAAMSSLNKVADVVPELLIGAAVDVVVRGSDSFAGTLLGVESRYQQLAWLAAINVVVWVIESSSQYVADVLWRGLAQGIGQALFEEMHYDDSGELLSGTLNDYTVPRAHHFPTFESHHTTTPTDINPMGAKGIGEAATIGSTPATANAVIDALEPFGITHLDVPMTPQKVWSAIQASTSGKAAAN